MVAEFITNHDNDVWPMPSDPLWIPTVQDRLKSLRDRVEHLKNHSHLVVSGDIQNYTMQFLIAYKNKLGLALRNTDNIQTWLNLVVALERTEIIGHEVRTVRSKADFITRILLSAEMTNKKLRDDPIVKQDYYVRTPPPSDFRMARSLSKYLAAEIGDHNGYSCKKKGCV